MVLIKTVAMAGHSSISVPLVLIVVMGTCTTVDCESVARLNVVFPQLDSSNDQTQASSTILNRSTATLSQSDLKIQKLHSEIKKLQNLVAKSFNDEKVVDQIFPSSTPNNVHTIEKIGTTPKAVYKTVNPPKESIKKKASEQRSDGFDLVSLQHEIELLQKQLTGDGSIDVNGNQVNAEKINEDYISEIKLPEVDPKSRQTNEGRRRPHYSNYAHPYNMIYPNRHFKNEKSEEDPEDYSSPTETDSEQNFRFVGGKTKNIVLDLVLEVLKLVAGGDGKGIIGAVLKLPPLIISGLLQGVVGSLSKGGLRGLIVRFLVPLIALVGINGLVVFMAWWLWEDTTCNKLNEIDSKPKPGYPSSLSQLYGHPKNY